MFSLFSIFRLTKPQTKLVYHHVNHCFTKQAYLSYIQLPTNYTQYTNNRYQCTPRL